MRLAISGLLLFATMGGPALAEEYGELSRRCYESGTPDQIIDACSTVIAAGIAEREDLGTAFKNRASAYDDKAANHPIALGNRCFARAMPGRFEQALDDCNRSLP